MRAFIAIDIKSSEVVKEITALQRRLLGCGVDLKLVSPENLHFTIKFLGEISDIQADKVVESLKQHRFKPFEATYRGIGVFPGFKRISVIWVGVDRDAGLRLSEIAESIDKGLQSIAPGDSKKFQPHLTVSRVKTGRNKESLLRLVDEYSEHIFGSDRIDEVKLKKSELTPKGPIYTDLFRMPFNEG